MSFGFSVGDILLCTQLGYRIYFALTDGRKTAPRDLKALESVLFSLTCCLNHLYSVSETFLSPIADKSDQDEAIPKQLGIMIRSCLQTLNELEEATQKYRAAADDLPPMLNFPNSVASSRVPQQFKERIKIQWRRFLWDLKRDSFCCYRDRLQSHVASINLLLNTFILSAAIRIEETERRQAQRIDGLLCDASRFNSMIPLSTQITFATRLAPQENSPGPSESIHRGGQDSQGRVL